MKQAFLGIERSLKGRRWIDRMSQAQTQVALDIAQRYGIADILARVLAGRGVTADQALGFAGVALEHIGR